MKKTLLFILFILTALSGCTTTKVDIDKLIIYSLNDLHGSVDSEDFAILGDFLLEEKNKNPDNIVILAAGDMLQGTAISNMSQGKVIIELMNEIGFDAMTIGNHEFDWGIDVIKGFVADGDVRATFPLLGANIYEKASDDRVSWAEPYAIIERGDLKVGIIGTIGESLTSSISPSIIKPYTFKDELAAIKTYAKELRSEKNVDIVIVLSHNDTRDYNQALADLVGDYQIDAVINGHTHANYYGETRGTEKRLPYVQSSSNAKVVGKIVLDIDEDNNVIDGSAMNIKVDYLYNEPNNRLNDIIDKYNQEAGKISSKIIGIAGKNITRFDGTIWAASVIREKTNADVGIVNYGGIRSVAFPINNGESITIGRIWELMPFDNIVKTVDLKVSDIVSFLNRDGMVYSNNIYLDKNNNLIKIDGYEYYGDDILNVATIDYLFDNERYVFLDGDNIYNTNDLIRDCLIENLENTSGLFYGS